MKLAAKIRYLREVEGELRGLGRAMTQQELLRAIAKETGASLSQSYVSQIESGARPHLTNTTRLLLAEFFKVHPGYLVDDPEGYHAELLSDARELLTPDAQLDLWLVGGAERFAKDADLRHALLALARHADSRRCLLLLESILCTDGLADRLLEVLRPLSALAQQKGSAVLSAENAVAKPVTPRPSASRIVTRRARQPRTTLARKQVRTKSAGKDGRS